MVGELKGRKFVSLQDGCLVVSWVKITVGWLGGSLWAVGGAQE